MKILVNLSNLTQNGVIPLWLKKFQELEKCNNQIYFHLADKIIKVNLQKNDLYQFNTTNKDIQNIPTFKLTKLNYINFVLKRNILALKTIKNIKNKYDVIYSPSSVLDLIILPYFLKKHDKKIIWSTVFDNIVPFTDPGNKITRLLAWIFFQISLLMIKKADIIFVISNDLKDYLIKKNFNPNKIIVTGNGVETELILKAKKNNKYKIDALFIGRINETKGIFDMLQVLKKVTIKIPNFQLAIMGDGDTETKSKFLSQINKLNLKNNVQFLGYIVGQEKFNVIRSSKSFWFLSVSQSESFGIALMEAVTSGIYGFVYNMPVFKKIYKNHEVFFSPKHNTISVANKVISLFKSKKFLNENGQKLLEKYSWENIIDIENKAINQTYKQKLFDLYK